MVEQMIISNANIDRRAEPSGFRASGIDGPKYRRLTLRDAVVVDGEVGVEVLS